MLQRFFRLPLRQRVLRTVKKRPMALSFAAVSCLVLFHSCGFYRSEKRDYSDVFARYPDGAVEVSLRGDWNVLPNGNTVSGNPYALLVRYVDAVHMREVESLSITARGRITGVMVPLPAAKPDPFKPVPPRGQFGFGPDGQDALAVPRNQYTAIWFPDLRLEYQPYEVSGVLVLRGTDGAAREVRFQGVLVPQPRSEWRSRFWDGMMSV
jgi:hypothetical protein